MRITVKIKPNAKVNIVEKIAEGIYSVRVKAPAKEGKANEALVKTLADHFDIPKSRIEIVSGMGSRTKIVEIT